MNFDILLGMVFGAFLVVAITGIVLMYLIYTEDRDVVFDETSEDDTEKI